MNKKRPVNLDLTTLQFPPAAISSILHRISGVVLFLILPVALWMLSQSLDSADAFNALKANLDTLPYKFITWVSLSALAYHLIAGFRHLLMDVGFGESLKTGQCTAKAVIALSVIVIVFLGICLW